MPTRPAALLDRTNFGGSPDPLEESPHFDTECSSPYYGSENKNSEFGFAQPETRVNFGYESP